MGGQIQIMKGKKKGRGRGRPSKADLALRAAEEARELRRKLRRRRSSRGVDYEDDDGGDDYSVSSSSSSEYDDDEEDRRREKKLKLVLKLPSNGEKARACGGRRRIGASAGHAPMTEYAAAYSSSSPENKLLKKRKAGGYDCDYGGDENDGNVDSDSELRRQKGDWKRIDSVTGTPSDPASGSGVPLPDKKSLELILDKLQKKDTYCVYAEPVDPEELPDYHDIIDHPMDFATVRKKLVNGSYSTLEQFESDVFLICSNAMQYNSPETIYHRQARSIQELARKKFERLRIEFEPSEKELKPGEKTTASLIAKKAISRSVQEPIGSDFDSGATLATAGDIQSDLNINQAVCEKPNFIDGVVEVNSTQVDTNFDKAEELSSGKSLPSKFGKKPFLLDENRRASYHISNQTVDSSEQVVSIFEGENKQLVAVGLHAECSYARSLARFAATLGPVAWKVASKRIEQVLPAGFKFGRGWVGEYEPVPTSVLMLETYSPRVPLAATGSPSAANLRKEDRIFKAPFPAKEDAALTRVKLEGRLPFAGSIGHGSIQQNSAFRKVVEPKDNVSRCAKQDPIHLASQNRNDLAAGKKQCSSGLEIPPSMSIEAVSHGRNLLQSGSSLKPLGANTSRAIDGAMANGKVLSNDLEKSREINFSSDSVANPKAGTCIPKGPHLVYGEPVGAMTMLTQKAQKQQKPSNHFTADMAPVPSPAPSLSRDDHQNGSAATAGTVAPTWIGMGAGGGYRPEVETPSAADRNQISADSLYNPTRESYSQNVLSRGGFPVSGGMHFQPPKNGFPFQAFAPEFIQMSNEAQSQNRPLVFSQLVNTDLSRLQLPIRGFSPRNNQLRQKQDALPPDLNIRFQPLGSPVKQTPGVSGILVDSQQPDLALQL